MNARNVMVAICAMCISGLIAGCIGSGSSGDETQTEGSDTFEGKDDSVQIDAPASSPQRDSHGNCCWGHCSNGYTFNNAAITHDCRAYVVDRCHSTGYTFDPNGDAWWGVC